MHRKNKMISPDFLVIGAGRSGTTWLSKVFNARPDFWMPPIKELHYFDRDLKYSSPSYLYNNSFFRRLFGFEKHNLEFKKRMLKTLSKQLIDLDFKNFLWCLKYFVSYINDNWYLSLFRYKSNDKITGDITPAYQLLEKENIRKIHSLLPKLKIIFIIRNPIHRTWSQIRKNFKTHLNDYTFEKVLNSSDISKRNDYIYTISNWTHYYKQEQFLLCYFDELIENPNQFLSRIYKFLGVSIDTKNNFNYNKRINSSPSLKMSSANKKELFNKMMPILIQLNNKLGSYTSRWLREARNELKELNKFSEL